MADRIGAGGGRPLGTAVATPYLEELESLRGIAMLLVLLFHLNALIAGPAAARPGVSVSIVGAYVSAGHSGVNLFFVLSGFLLSLPFLAAARGGPRLATVGPMATMAHARRERRLTQIVRPG